MPLMPIIVSAINVKSMIIFIYYYCFERNVKSISFYISNVLPLLINYFSISFHYFFLPVFQNPQNHLSLSLSLSLSLAFYYYMVFIFWFLYLIQGLQHYASAAVLFYSLLCRFALSVFLYEILSCK